MECLALKAREFFTEYIPLFVAYPLLQSSMASQRVVPATRASLVCPDGLSQGLYDRCIDTIDLVRATTYSDPGQQTRMLVKAAITLVRILHHFSLLLILTEVPFPRTNSFRSSTLSLRTTSFGRAVSLLETSTTRSPVVAIRRIPTSRLLYPSASSWVSAASNSRLVNTLASLVRGRSV